MLNFISVFLSVILIFIIFFRPPQNDGIVSFSTKSDLLGSPNSAKRFLNNLTGFLIILYVLVALKLDLN